MFKLHFFLFFIMNKNIEKFIDIVIDICFMFILIGINDFYNEIIDTTLIVIFGMFMCGKSLIKKDELNDEKIEKIVNETLKSIRYNNIPQIRNENLRRPFQK